MFHFYSRLCPAGFVYSGYGYPCITTLQSSPGTGMKHLQNSQKFRIWYTNAVPIPLPAPGYFYKGIPVPWVLSHGRSELNEKSGYGYECRTELTEVPGTGKYPGYGFGRTLQNTAFSLADPGTGIYGSLTELTQVPGTGMEVLQNSHRFRVGTRVLYPYPYPHAGIFKRAYTRTPGIVPRAYRTWRSSRYA